MNNCSLHLKKHVFYDPRDSDLHILMSDLWSVKHDYGNEDDITLHNPYDHRIEDENVYNDMVVNYCVKNDISSLTIKDIAN